MVENINAVRIWKFAIDRVCLAPGAQFAQVQACASGHEGCLAAIGPAEDAHAPGINYPSQRPSVSTQLFGIVDLACDFIGTTKFTLPRFRAEECTPVVFVIRRDDDEAHGGQVFVEICALLAE